MTNQGMRSAPTLAGAVTMTAASLMSTRASADNTNPSGQVKWAIEVDGSACVKARAMIDREIALACDAMTTCRLAPRPEAELVATLRCPEPEEGGAGWSLETRTASGMMVGAISLTGVTTEDRMREAAMEIARDAAPERTLAAENLRNTLVSPSQNDRDRVTWMRSKSVREPDARVAVSAAGFGSLGFDSEANGFGGRVTGGYRTSIGHVTLSLAGATSSDVTEAKVDVASWRRVQGGAGIGVGAPFDERKIFGLLAELGVDGTQRYFAVEKVGEMYWAARTTARGYARVAGALQLPITPYVRPYLAISGSYLSDRTLSATGDVGMTFPLF